MKVEEIRKKGFVGEIDVQQEIAAQLAELNEKSQWIMDRLKVGFEKIS